MGRYLLFYLSEIKRLEVMVMAVSYNKLWKLLIDKKVSISELRKNASIAPNTMTKLRRDENVNLSILERICEVLNCDFSDIMTYISEDEKRT
jgi:DNA-binding Xre family transcriptional regulator